jgi:anti-sigma factor RsiW
MAHEDNELLLHGYFDGELDLIRSVEFEEHLRACPDCARGALRPASHAPVVAFSESLRTGP